MQKFLIAIVLAFSGIPCSFADSDGAKIDSLAARYERYSRENPQERVTLHFDNTSYYKGEHIYYKANVTCGGGLKATPLSRILYVDLVSPVGYPLQTQKLIIRDGQSYGSFFLDSTLVAGYYEVRAYTSWMLNFCKADKHGWSSLTNKAGKDTYGKWMVDYLRWNAGLFSRVFPVYESVDSGHYERRYMAPLPKVTSTIVEEEKDKLQVSFYPEGGNLVKDVPTRIAFEARTKKGTLVDIEGNLKRGGDTIGCFKTAYAGRGVFAVTPTDSTDELTQGLHLTFTYSGKDYDIKLPSTKRHGYVLNVIRRGNDYLATVRRNEATRGRQLGLIVACRGVMQIYEVLNLSELTETTISVPSDVLPTGVNIFTLFDADGDIISQREIFVNNHELDAVHVASNDTIGLDSIKRMSIRLSLEDGEGKPLRRKDTFSLSVTDADTRENTYSSESNTLTDLLLSSEIKGFIPFANYYFERDDEQHRLALDLLMMVQGWTRYDFKEMTGQTVNPWYYKIECGLSLEGYIYKPWTNGNGYPRYPLLEQKPKKDIYVYAEMIGKANDSIGVGEVLAKKNDGKFYMNIPLVYGRRKMMIALNNKPQEKLPTEEQGAQGHTVIETRFAKEYPLRKEFAIHLGGAFPPLAKPYSPYETAFTADASYASNKRSLGYDPALEAFVLPEFTKVAQRKWDNIDLSKPLLNLPIDEYMTYASHVTGMLEDFHNFFFLSNMNDTGLLTRYAKTIFGELLGLSGEGIVTINGHSLRNGVTTYSSSNIAERKPTHFIYTFGKKELLGKGMEFLPPTYGFKRMRIYADLRNREAIYQSANNVALSYRLDYITDTAAITGFPMPVFMGKTFVFHGISQPDEFYSPDYSKMPLPEGQHDYRRTLYWNPCVTTNEDGTATVEFYNNSTCKRLHISAGGLTGDGHPIIGKRILTVPHCD